MYTWWRLFHLSSSITCHLILSINGFLTQHMCHKWNKNCLPARSTFVNPVFSWGSNWSFSSITYFYVLVSFSRKPMFGSYLLPFSCRGSNFIYFIYLHLHFCTYNGLQQDIHIRWYSCDLTLTWWFTLVEQVLLIIQDHLSSSPSF